MSDGQWYVHPGLNTTWSDYSDCYDIHPSENTPKISNLLQVSTHQRTLKIDTLLLMSTHLRKLKNRHVTSSKYPSEKTQILVLCFKWVLMREHSENRHIASSEYLSEHSQNQQFASNKYTVRLRWELKSSVCYISVAVRKTRTIIQLPHVMSCVRRYT